MGQHFPEEMHFTIRNLPTGRISAKPLFGLLEGFSMDLLFASKDTAFHVADEAMLEKYATFVASTVAEMCIELISTYATNLHDYARLRNEVLQAGRTMGVALQYVNIARDIRVDARMGRVYLPTTWLVEQGLKPKDILDDPDRPEVEWLRLRLLDRAFGHYQSARSHIDLLPYTFRGPVRVMIESYMEIGRTLQRQQYQVRDGKATVGRLRRLWVAWKALIV
jgi:15-cis-phytoene synthase / lycopene beta-cyclase